MPSPSTSLADSVWFWCVCVGGLAVAATWFAARAWFRSHYQPLLSAAAQMAKDCRREYEETTELLSKAKARALADDEAQSELQAKLRALESLPLVGQQELEALIVRRWLRNAGEHANPSPQKAISSAAAVALAFVGAEHFRQRIAPLTLAAKQAEAESAATGWVQSGPTLTEPETQASLQWLQALQELDALLDPEASPKLIDEWLRGRIPSGEYWNTRALRLAAGEILTQGHLAAMEIARKRANGSAGLGPATEPPDGSPTSNRPPA